MKRLLLAATFTALMAAAAWPDGASGAVAAVDASGAIAAGDPAGQTVQPLSIQELVEMGSARNLDIQKARRALSDALEDLKWKTTLADTRLDLSGAYETSSHAVSGQATLSVPVIPQFSVDASIADTGSGGASLKLFPFAQGDAKYLLRKAYDLAALGLTYAEEKLAADIEAAAYSALTARTSLSLAKARLSLQEEKTAVAESSYSLGRLSYTDLDGSRSDLISARQAVFDAERALLSARIALFRLLGPSVTEAEVQETGATELDAAIAARDAQIDTLAGAEPRTLALRQAVIELSALTQELSQTWLYRPDVSVAAGISYQPASSLTFSPSVNLSFSFSPSDIKTEERSEIKKDIDFKEQEVSLERLASRFQAQILAQALSVARETLNTRAAELAQAEATAAQGEVLLSQGRWTSIEKEQAGLNVDSARAGVVAAQAAVLSAQAQILLLYGI